MELINGKIIADTLLEQLKQEVSLFCRSPRLDIIFIGNNPASQVYVNKKAEAGKRAGINVVVHKYDSLTQTELVDLTDDLNNSKEVDGIIIQLPVNNLDLTQAFTRISPQKDVDCLNPLSLGMLWQGTNPMLPATPAAIICALEFVANKNGHDLSAFLAGKQCVIVGRSIIIGKPLAAALLNLDATVTIAHSKTTSLEEVCSKADILISAAGKENLITAEMIKQGAVVIDAGFSKKDNKTFGDVNREAALTKADYLSPVPGGIGPLGVVMLLKNTLSAAKSRN